MTRLRRAKGAALSHRAYQMSISSTYSIFGQGMSEEEVIISDSISATVVLYVPLYR
jgi:hypothetical protein